MIIKCLYCNKYFDDQFRLWQCPHNTFMANDGQNNFKFYPEAWLADHSPLLTPRKGEAKSEYNVYQEWLDKNRIRY